MTSLTTYKDDFQNPLPYYDELLVGNVDEIIDALKNTPNSGKLDVRGTMGLKGSLFKYDTLTFADASTLMLESVDVDYVALAVKEIILDIKNPTFRAFLSRPIGTLESEIMAALNGSGGPDGQAGAQGTTHDRVGQPGGSGAAGGNGQNGGTRQLPKVYFFIQAIKFGTEATPDKQYLYLNFLGFHGGNGGKGGNGGPGGRGGNGDRGAPGFGYCKEGGGAGGNGGFGGNGGSGGNGSSGGNGGSLYLFAPKSEMFDYSTANIEGGKGGVGGAAGIGGNGGLGGSGASSIGPCGSKPNGRHGARGTDGTIGNSATDGDRGVQIVRKRDNGDLF